MGPSTPSIRWTVDTGESGLLTSVTIAADGTLYSGRAGDSGDHALFAFAPDGSTKWSEASNWRILAQPAIGEDGLLFVAPDNGALAAKRPDGTSFWVYDGNIWPSDPMLDGRGTVYVGADGELTAVGSGGSEKWSVTASHVAFDTAAIAPSGVVYAGASDTLYAVAPDGVVEWSREVGVALSPVSTAPDGTVYVGSLGGALYALSPEGDIQWTFSVGAWVTASPAIAADGTLYFAAGGKLYALTRDGDEIWSVPMSGTYDFFRSPVIDQAGTIFVACGDVHAFRTDGSVAWSLPVGNAFGAPAIGADGTLYVGTFDGKLFAIGGERLP